MAPFVVPGIVLAIAFYAAYAPPPLALYGTATILILAFATRFLPIGYANADAAIRSINPEMEEAVRILGGGRLLAIRRVLAPLMKRSLIGAWLLVFIPATRELSTAMFLYGPKTRTMSVMLMDMSEEGNFESLAALGFLLLASTLLIVGIATACWAGTSCCDGSANDDKLSLIGLGKSFGARAGGAGRLAVACSRASSCRCWGRPAAARRRRCA